MSNAVDFEIKDGVLTKYCGPGGDVEIPNGVTAIGYGAFKECRSLRSIRIPNSVMSIGDCAFLWCTCLKTIRIPDGITKIGFRTFAGCSSLTGASIPDSVTLIESEAFKNCSKLIDISIPDSVQQIERAAFSGCESLVNEQGLVVIRDVLYVCDKNITSVSIPQGVTVIEAGAFENCYGLQKVSIPASVTTIGGSAFKSCHSLKKISIPAGVTAIGSNAFENCHGLKTIAIPSSIKEIKRRTFCCCTRLTGITIPTGVTSIGEEAFAYCDGVKTITLSDSVTEVGDKAFYDCYKLKELTIPSALAERLSTILPKGSMPVIHVQSIENVSTKYRPGAAVGFAEDDRDCTDANGLAYLKYIKTNAEKLAPLACKHPVLFYLMIREKLIEAKHLEAVSEAVQASGNTEMIAAILEYGSSAVSDKDKIKVQAKKEAREENVTNFIFDAGKVETLMGKTIVVTGKLKTFTSRDELKECLAAVGAELTETLSAGVDFLLTNTPNSGTAKNKKAEELGVRKITEQEFNDLIGRHKE